MSSTPPFEESTPGGKRSPFILMPVSERQRRASLTTLTMSDAHMDPEPSNPEHHQGHHFDPRFYGTFYNALAPGTSGNTRFLQTQLRAPATAMDNQPPGFQTAPLLEFQNRINISNSTPVPNPSNLSSMQNVVLQRKLREFYDSRAAAASGSSTSHTYPVSNQVYRQPSYTRIPTQESPAPPKQQQPGSCSSSSTSSLGIGISKSMRKHIRAVVETELNQGDTSSTSNDHSSIGNISVSSKVIQQLEDKLKEAHLKLHEKDCEILSIRQELHTLRKAIEEAMSESKSSKTLYGVLKYDLMNVEKQLECLQEKVATQELKQTFLNNQASRTSSSTSCSSADSAPTAAGALNPNAPSGTALDYDRLIRNIRDLNGMVGSGACQTMELCYNSGGATFKHTPQAITIILYKNGIWLDDDRKFRPLNAPETSAFIQDISDGYFPSELQTRYPNGIILVVNDSRATKFGPEGSSHVFTGKGYRFSKDTSNQPVTVPKILPGTKFNCMKHRVKSSTSPEFKIPNPSSSENSIIAGTSSLSSIGSSASSTTLSIEQLPDLLITSGRGTGSAKYTDKASSSRRNQVITLKLRHHSSNGKQYKLLVNVNSTINEIAQHLEKFVEGGGDSEWTDYDHNPAYDDGYDEFQKYQLINSLPFGLFASCSSTLKDYKIVNNSLLYFRKIYP